MTVTINGTSGITTPGVTNSGSQTVSGTGTFASTISVGNVTPAATGAGITFPATQSASSDANTLDDYEEGTWNPDVYNLGASSSFTGKVGYYRKVGSLVMCWFCCDYGNSGGGGGELLLSGLPFSIGSFSLNPSWGIWGSNSTPPTGNIIAGGGSIARLYYGGNNTGATITFVTGSFSYFV